MGPAVISPHGVARERWLFLWAVDADRDRRAKGLPDRTPDTGSRKPLAGATLLDQMKARLRPHVQATYFTGGNR